MSKSLVTGGCGFIGSHLVDKLISIGHEVVVIDDLSTGKIEYLNKSATFIEGSILNFELLNQTIHNIDYVFHFAALPRIQPSFTDPVSHEQVNVLGTINCIMASLNKNVKKFVFAGSSSCYGNTKQIPTSELAPINCLSPYALQKYTAEQYCLILGERYSLPVNSVRIFNPYGPRSFNPENKLNAYSSVVGIFHDQNTRNSEITITGNGEQSRDFVHVYDLVDATILAATKDVEGEAINIGFGESHTILELASMFPSSDIKFIPPRSGEAAITLSNTQKAKDLLGWSPKINLKKGVELLNVHGKN